MAEATHTHEGHEGHEHVHGDEEKLALTVEVSEVGPCEKALAITVATESVGKRLLGATRELKKVLSMPGFRPGHAPKRLVEKRFQDRIQAEVRGALLEAGLRQALEEKGWGLLGDPTWPEEKEIAPVEPGKPYSFRTTVLVRPEIVLPNYVGVEVPKPSAKVSPDVVEAEIRQIRMKRAQWVPSGGAATPNDLVVFDAEFRAKGEVVHRSVGAEAIPRGAEGKKGYEWVAGLVGAKPGEKRPTKGKLPPDLPNAAFRGAEGEIAVEVRAVKRLEVPELDAAWLKELGVSSADELRKSVAEGLRVAADRDAHAALEDRIVDTLLERTPIELPAKILERETEGYLQRFEIALRNRKVAEADIPKLLDEERNERRGKLERGFKRFFLLDEIGKKEKIFATEEDVAERVREMAAHYKRTVPDITAELEARGMMRELRGEIREEKVRRFLREKAILK